MALDCYIAEIRNPEYTSEDWRQRHIEELTGYGVKFDGGSYSEDQDDGDWLFAEVNEVLGLYPELEQAQPGGPCPYVGALLGFFVWLPWCEYNPSNENHTMLIANIRSGMGHIQRCQCDPSFEGFQTRVPLKRVSGLWSCGRYRVQLSTILSKWGFDDGAMLIENDEDSRYLNDLLQAISERLRQVGVEPLIGLVATSHNPIRFNLFVQRKGKRELHTLFRMVDGVAASEAEIFWILDREVFEFWFLAFRDFVGGAYVEPYTALC